MPSNNLKKMQVAIIDYNAGNVQSVLYAMERLQVEAVLTAARRMRDGAGSAAATQGGGGASS